MNPIQKRINYSGDIIPLIEDICREYSLGTYKSHNVITTGYEDFNVQAITEKGNFLIKFFGAFRSFEEVTQYIKIMNLVIDKGVNHPRLYPTSNGHLYEIKIDQTIIRVCVLEFIQGHNLLELNKELSQDDKNYLIQQAATINTIEYKPVPVYDSWAVVNFEKEYLKKEHYLSEIDKKYILPALKEFSEINLQKLPHAFVHGDIIKTNVMNDVISKLWILDFAVANWYPRIVDLSVLLCNILFDSQNLNSNKEIMSKAINTYSKTLNLTSEEIEAIPKFIKAAHSMHVLCSLFEKHQNNNDSKENEYWLAQGRLGIATNYYLK
jgi:Ser/Thr protein kinase RdoA (MazF antagonist)